MNAAPDDTCDVALESWVESANVAGCDFPIQNLPFGRFRREDDDSWCIGVAIGDQVLDLRKAGVFDTHDMNRVIRLKREQRQAVRQAISEGLRKGSAQRGKFEAALLSQADLELGVPCTIRDYTDFYVGIHHATAIGKQFRPDSPLLPNYKWVPIGYHGRASTIVASGSSFHRPVGQTKAPDDASPAVNPSARLDLELELGIVISRPNVHGVPIPLDAAEEHVFGITLFNDWSARDIQGWEYQPLGPFLSKNFASTISPWMVTLEALEPFRKPWSRPEGDPRPLPYLDSQANSQRGAFDIGLEVWLQTARMEQAGHAGDCISRSNFAQAAYWTVAQLVAHHTVNGCSLSAGDLFGSGTLSGPRPEQAGSLLELTSGGKQPLQLSNGEKRTYLQDGDSIILKGFCERPGFRRIGFGECRGKVLPARA
ncbi:fumarylacetoacetase [Ramlibacter sp. Leaf400]|uniref:fumarylacetoacetase n=1 Tax=Ramlibacter sp. Leaf400 TaxID=1736365 RepID=UPI0006F89F8C|nr:fumarylacetoacetase [Ramlibacter sp. Leaf400]KQT13190.1 fumarylacetoacetase [Ramlibacter sp. Leaf400]